MDTRILAASPTVRSLRQRVPVAPRLQAAEKARRDERIVADRARGLRWSTIAQKHNLSERQAREVWRERLSAEHLESLDGRDAIAEALLQIEAAIEDLALLAQTTNNDPVRLGAIRARLDAMGDRVTPLRVGGYLPRTWRDAMVEANFRTMSENIVEVLEKHGVFNAVAGDLLAALRTQGARSNGHAR